MTDPIKQHVCLENCIDESYSCAYTLTLIVNLKQWLEDERNRQELPVAPGVKAVVPPTIYATTSASSAVSVGSRPPVPSPNASHLTRKQRKQARKREQQEALRHRIEGEQEICEEQSRPPNTAEARRLQELQAESRRLLELEIQRIREKYSRDKSIL